MGCPETEAQIPNTAPTSFVGTDYMQDGQSAPLKTFSLLTIGHRLYRLVPVDEL